MLIEQKKKQRQIQSGTCKHILFTSLLNTIEFVSKSIAFSGLKVNCVKIISHARSHIRLLEFCISCENDGKSRKALMVCMS